MSPFPLESAAALNNDYSARFYIRIKCSDGLGIIRAVGQSAEVIYVCNVCMYVMYVQYVCINYAKSMYVCMYVCMLSTRSFNFNYMFVYVCMYVRTYAIQVYVHYVMLTLSHVVKAAGVSIHAILQNPIINPSNVDFVVTTELVKLSQVNFFRTTYTPLYCIAGCIVLFK